MNSLQLSVVHRLPQSYRWLTGCTGIRVEPIPLNGSEDDDNLIGFKMLSHDEEDARRIMPQLKRSLDEIQVECSVLEWEGETCLFLHRQDESTALCRLKNLGVAIAEPISPQYPF
ncbi:YejG family protein [Lonsdalea quercina]|uniref:YejG-like protein n=1 Tax=Lonsdalea quercina TaxID=71657 RepID=A0A1H4BSR9_9GAMM|nr:YejG family protein [Lonsdalea quercina]SEA51216.1 YejG-like protein [Lonsdalea quercina]